MAFTLVSSVSAASSGGGNFTTSAIDTTGADLIVIVNSHYVNGSEPAISDSQSNTWSHLTSSQQTDARSRISYCISPTTHTSHTFTSTHAAAYPCMFVLAFSSTGTVVYDQQSNTQGTSTTGFAAGTLTGGDAGVLHVTGFAQAHTSTAMSTSITDSFTIDSSFNYSGGNNVGGSAAYKAIDTATALGPTWSFGMTGQYVGMVHATFTDGAGAGGTTIDLTTKTLSAWSGQSSQSTLAAAMSAGSVAAWSGQSTQNTATNSMAAGSVAAWSGQGTQNAVTSDLSAGSMGFTGQAISVIGNLVLELGSAAMSFVAGTVSNSAAAVVAGVRGMILNIGRLLNR